MKRKSESGASVRRNTVISLMISGIGYVYPVLVFVYIARILHPEGMGRASFASSFAAFCGVSLSYVREYGQVLTSVGLDFAKKTHDAEMDAIRQKTSVDPVGRLAILNNEYYSGGAVASDAGRVVESIPTAAAFGLIETAKIE